MEGGLKTNEPEVANILRKLDAETGGEADEGAMLCNQQRAIVRRQVWLLWTESVGLAMKEDDGRGMMLSLSLFLFFARAKLSD